MSLEASHGESVEEQVASSSNDVVDEKLRNTFDEDNGETQVTDATPSSSSTSITAGSSSSRLTQSNRPNRMMTGFGTPSEVIEVLQDIPGFSLSWWSILDSSGRRICIIRYIGRNSLKADCDINGHAKNYKLHIDIEVKCLVADATATAWIVAVVDSKRTMRTWTTLVKWTLPVIVP